MAYRVSLSADMKWEIQKEIRSTNHELRSEEILEVLLANRGLTSKKAVEGFLNPKLDEVTVESVGINKIQLRKALRRIFQAIEQKEQIVVFGDYDVDGITASAILWETLYGLGANVLPYIPNRIDEGYGLSSIGISNVQLQMSNVKLIITVDNGIVANEAVEFANKKDIDVIITDHHLPHEDEKHSLPDAFAIVHTTKLCGAGVAYLLSQEIISHYHSEAKQKNPRLPAGQARSFARAQDDMWRREHLALAALATIADMVPLQDANRAIVKHGIAALRKTRRLGLLALLKEAAIEQSEISTYDIGFVISPRLNASGRMASAMDSLRLLCTRDEKRATQLARLLNKVNKERQEEMTRAAEHAVGQIANRKSQIAKLLFVSHESYQQGVIGLVAGKLVEKFYRPAIVVSIGQTQSKASVRSVKGFNIIDFLRLHTEHFVNVGGHPMAAGFTVETTKITALQQALEQAAEKALLDEHLEKKLVIDCEIPLSSVSQKLYRAIQVLSPFGMGNPQPIFVSRVRIADARSIGKEGKHLKLRVSSVSHESGIMNYGVDAIGFGLGERASELKRGQEIDVAYVIDENTWNGETKLQLKMRDFVHSRF